MIQYLSTQNTHRKKLIDFMKGKKTKPPTYREKRKEGSVKNFLGGEARKPYVLREDIACGLKNRVTQINGENENKNGRKDTPCICHEALGQFSDMFNNMIHTDQYLINRLVAKYKLLFLFG